VRHSAYFSLCVYLTSPFFHSGPAPPELSTLSLHDALPISSPVSSPRSTPSPAYSLRRGEVREPGRDLRDEHQEDHQAELDRQVRSEEHTSELQSRFDLVCRLLLEKKKTTKLRQGECQSTSQ